MADEIRVITKEGFKHVAVLRRSDFLAVHSAMPGYSVTDGRFTVSHINTGLAVVHCPTQEAAEEMMTRLAIFDWRFEKAEGLREQWPSVLDILKLGFKEGLALSFKGIKQARKENSYAE